MITRIIDAKKTHAITLAARLINKGALVAFPTETVYGLGANAFNSEACMKIFAAKNRPADNPLIVHVCDREMLYTVVSQIPDVANRLIDTFWPGPITLILKKSSLIPDSVTAGLDTVAVRMPEHPDALRLIRACGVPIAAPSANSSGRPSPTKAQHVYDDLNGRIKLILDGGKTTAGVESTIIDVTGPLPVLLRPGIISPELIETVTGPVTIDKGISAPPPEGAAPRAPGMKYMHYSPKAQVLACISPDKPQKIISHARRTNGSKGVICLTANRPLYEKSGAFDYIVSAPDADGLCAVLFDSYRTADSMGVNTIYCESIDTRGSGLAYMNRLLKAAGYQTI